MSSHWKGQSSHLRSSVESSGSSRTDRVPLDTSPFTGAGGRCAHLCASDAIATAAAVVAAAAPAEFPVATMEPPAAILIPSRPLRADPTSRPVDVYGRCEFLLNWRPGDPLRVAEQAARHYSADGLERRGGAAMVINAHQRLRSPHEAAAAAFAKTAPVAPTSLASAVAAGAAVAAAEERAGAAGAGGAPQHSAKTTPSMQDVFRELAITADVTESLRKQARAVRSSHAQMAAKRSRRAAAQRRNGTDSAASADDGDDDEWTAEDRQAMQDLLALEEFDTNIETVYAAAKKFAIDPDEFKARLAHLDDPEPVWLEPGTMPSETAVDNCREAMSLLPPSANARLVRGWRIRQHITCLAYDMDTTASLQVAHLHAQFHTVIETRRPHPRTGEPSEPCYECRTELNSAAADPDGDAHGRPYLFVPSRRAHPELSDADLNTGRWRTGSVILAATVLGGTARSRDPKATSLSESELIEQVIDSNEADRTADEGSGPMARWPEELRAVPHLCVVVPLAFHKWFSSKSAAAFAGDGHGDNSGGCRLGTGIRDTSDVGAYGSVHQLAAEMGLPVAALSRHNELISALSGALPSGRWVSENADAILARGGEPLLPALERLSKILCGDAWDSPCRLIDGGMELYAHLCATELLTQYLAQSHYGTLFERQCKLHQILDERFERVIRARQSLQREGKRHSLLNWPMTSRHTLAQRTNDQRRQRMAAAGVKFAAGSGGGDSSA